VEETVEEKPESRQIPSRYETQLFAGTIGDNIALGAEDRSFERVVAAAKFVGAHDFIQRLPQGYDTVLGERGSGLSAGQRQLIAIARALIRNPRILILDEATSALDAATETALLASLKRASRGRTIVLITHRPAGIAIADQVLHLAQGQVEHLGATAAHAGRGQPASPARALRPHLIPV
jgi:ABC-type multidrug transport system fused ATPase/permease subunit